MEFEWDEDKEQKNLVKHGISFARAVQTFRDPRGVMLVDLTHSEKEERLLWVGKDSDGKILTTRFTVRGKTIRIIGCGRWRKYRKIYENAKEKE